jgi:hypothetical protein
MRKKSLLVAIAFFLLSTSNFYAQTTNDKPVSPEQPYVASTFFSVSSGLNNYAGIAGIGIETKIYNNLAVYGGLGKGLWGLKSSLGLKLYKEFPFRRFFFLNYSHASGSGDSYINYEYTENNVPTNYDIKLKPASNINIGWGYQFRIVRNLRFGLELGYSILVSEKDSWELKNPTQKLSDINKKMFQILTPGGIIFGLNFSLGI